MKTLLSIVAILILAIVIVVVVAERSNYKRDIRAITNACINNLKAMQGAKKEWAIQVRGTTNATPTMEDLAPYMLGGARKCPSGGAYTIGPVGTDPTCSIKGHELPPPSAR